MHVAEHEADRVVELVGDAGDEAAERGHLLGEHQLLLGLTQILVRGGEFGIGATQLADRTADQHETDEAPLVIAS